MFSDAAQDAMRGAGIAAVIGVLTSFFRYFTSPGRPPLRATFVAVIVVSTVGGR